MKQSRLTEEQIVRILAEAEREGKTVRQLCGAHAISENTYYV